MFRLLLAVFLFVFNTSVFSQSIEEGKKFIYYERFKSAKDLFEKMLQSTPNQPVASYWLSQAYLGLDNVDKARQVILIAMNSSPNDPMLMTAMGELELLRNNKELARNLFESALTISKEKDIEVLHAIGRANVNAKEGDTKYAITQLQKATQIKKFNDAGVHVTIGDAYRKLLDGGNAVLAYQSALAINPQYAAAIYKEGLIYKTQKNKEIYMPAFEKSVAMDPQYGPAYYSLYVHYYERDVVKAEEYLNKYISVIDADPQNDYYRIDLKYASRKFQEALDAANQLIAQLGEAVKPRIYRLKAYSYKSLSDFSNAKIAADLFFAKASPGDIVPKDYELYADILAAIPPSQNEAYSYYEKAFIADSVLENKLEYIQKAIDLAKANKDKKVLAYWTGLKYLNKKNPSNIDLFSVGRAYYELGSEDFNYFYKADSVFAIYTEKYPATYNGYDMRGRINWSIDTSLTLGLANTHFEKMIGIAFPLLASKDSLSVKSSLKYAYRYFIGHYVVKKMTSEAMDYCNKFLSIEPENKDILDLRQKLTGVGKSPADKPKKP